MHRPMLELRLAGPLRLLDGGRPLRVRSTKALAILTLLAVAPGHRRNRTWLQDKLWSESPPEQGSASLRTTLSELRQALGPWRDAVTSENGWIGIDPARLRVVLEPAADEWELDSTPPEFAAGLDVADPEFEDWIRDQRLAFAEKLEAVGAPGRIGQGSAPRPILLVGSTVAASVEGRILGDLLVTEAATLVAQFGDAEVLRGAPGVLGTLPEGALSVGARVLSLDGAAVIQATVGEPAPGVHLGPASGIERVVWTAERRVRIADALAADCLPLQALVVELAAALIDRLAGRAREADAGFAQGYRALRDLGALDSATLVATDRRLETAYEARPRAAFLAWRAFLRFSAVVERQAGAFADAARSAEALARRAVAEEPSNPIVGALCSNVFAIISGRGDRAFELARGARDSHLTNAYARASYAYRLAQQNDAEAARSEALHARRLAVGQPNLVWWDMLCCVSALRCGRYAEATRFAELSHDMAPTYKPALRFLAALRHHRGDLDGATRLLVQLQRLEPGFTLPELLDDAYPVPSLRDTPLIAVAKSGLV